MSLKEYILWAEITNLLELIEADQKMLVEIFQQPQVQSQNQASQVHDLQNWWSQWTDPRGKIEKAKRLVQSVLNIVGRDGIRGTNNEDLVPVLTDIRARLMRAWNKMPDPKQRGKSSTPKLNYNTSTAGVGKI